MNTDNLKNSMTTALGENHHGWVYWNPDIGTEWAPTHPVESSEVPDADDVRRATAIEAGFAAKIAGQMGEIDALRNTGSELVRALSQKTSENHTLHEKLQTVRDTAFAWLARCGRHAPWCNPTEECSCGLIALHNLLCQAASAETR